MGRGEREACGTKPVLAPGWASARSLGGPYEHSLSFGLGGDPPKLSPGREGTAFDVISECFIYGPIWLFIPSPSKNSLGLLRIAQAGKRERNQNKGEMGEKMQTREESRLSEPQATAP